MDIIDLLKTKLRNDLLEELREYDIEDLESQIDDKITDDLFINDDKVKINDIPDENRCCARIMGERYSDQRCPYHKVKDDSRPTINEKGNKIAWRDDSALTDINTVIRYQNMKLLKNIK